MHLRVHRFAEPTLLALLAFAILWRGGKSIDATWLLAGIAGVLTVIGAWNSGEDEEQRVPRALWLLGLTYVLWGVLTFLLSTTRNYGLDELLRDASFFLIFANAGRAIEALHPARWRKFVRVLLGAALAACLLGIAIYVLQPVNRFVGSFFDMRFHTDYWPNAWAEFLLLVWPIALWWMFEATRLPRWSRFLACGLLFGCLFLSYSRGAFLVFLGQTVLLALLLTIPRTLDRKPQFPQLLGVLGTGAALGILLFWGVNGLRSMTFEVQSLEEKATFTATEGTSSIDERTQFWRQSLVLAKERPWTGWGPYSFRFIQPRLAEGVLATSDHPHNVFLKILVERGITGALLFAVFLLSCLYGIFRKAARSSRHLFGLVALSGVFAHNLIDYNLQFVGISLPFWMIIGMLSVQPPLKVKRIEPLLERIFAYALLIVTVAEAAFLLLSSLGRHAEAAGRDFEAIAWYQMADEQIFRRDMDLSRANLLIKNGLYDQGSIALDHYALFNAQDPRVWKLRARVMEQLGNLPEARHSIAEAWSRGRWTDVGIIRGYAEILQNINDASLWQEMTLRFVPVLESYAKAIQENAHFIALSSNVEEFLEAGRAVKKLCAPEDSPQCQTQAARIEVLSTKTLLNAEKERETYRARPSGYLW